MRAFPALLAVLLVTGTARAADVDVRILVTGDVRPGVYGRVDLLSAPPPPIVYERPMVIVKPARPAPVQPIYLHVPPGHAKNWKKHCRKYNACSQPVYFVRSAEYDPGYGKPPKKEKKPKKD